MEGAWLRTLDSPSFVCFFAKPDHYMLASPLYDTQTDHLSLILLAYPSSRPSVCLFASIQIAHRPSVCLLAHSTSPISVSLSASSLSQSILVCYSSTAYSLYVSLLAHLVSPSSVCYYCMLTNPANEFSVC
jgi:hypothetical protein